MQKTKQPLQGAARTRQRTMTMEFIILTPEEMKTQIGKPTYQRDINQGVVKDVVQAVDRGAAIAPGILTRNKFHQTGDLKGFPYVITDGQHRRLSMCQQDQPMAFVVYSYDTQEEETEAFVNFQKSRKVDPSLMVSIHPNDPLHQLIHAVQNDTTHPLYQRIWMGRGAHQKDQLRACKAVSIVKYGLASEDLPEFLAFLGASDSDFHSNALNSGSLRGLIHFYKNTLKGDVKPNDPTWERFWNRLNWSILITKDEAVNNTSSVGPRIGDALSRNWNRVQSNRKGKA
jgi:hypothetical protein